MTDTPEGLHPDRREKAETVLSGYCAYVWQKEGGGDDVLVSIGREDGKLNGEGAPDLSQEIQSTPDDYLTVDVVDIPDGSDGESMAYFSRTPFFNFILKRLLELGIWKRPELESLFESGDDFGESLADVLLECGYEDLVVENFEKFPEWDISRVMTFVRSLYRRLPKAVK